MLHQYFNSEFKSLFNSINKFKCSLLMSFLFLVQPGIFSKGLPSSGLINDTTKGQITVKLIETAGTNLVKYIGWSKGEDFEDGKLKSTQLFTKDTKDGYFRLDNFVPKKSSIVKKIDYLVLFDNV